MYGVTYINEKKELICIGPLKLRDAIELAENQSKINGYCMIYATEEEKDIWFKEGHIL